MPTEMTPQDFTNRRFNLRKHVTPRPKRPKFTSMPSHPKSSDYYVRGVDTAEFEQNLAAWKEIYPTADADLKQLHKEFKEWAIEKVGLLGHTQVDRAWCTARTRSVRSGSVDFGDYFQKTYDELAEIAALMLEKETAR